MTEDGAAHAGWLLLRNDAAGSDDVELVEAIAGGLATHGPAEVVTTAGAQDVDRALRAAEGRIVVLCGGDGSIQLAVGRGRRLGLLDELTFALVPLGTGNDLARHLGQELADAEDVVGRLLAAEPRQLDVLVGDDDAVVVNAVHVGVGVEAAQRAGELKDSFGALAYPMGALTAGVAADGLEVEVRLDGHRIDLGRPALMVIVANGTTIGGGAPAAPAAEPDDGLLDVVVVHAVEPTARVAFAGALLRGTHLDRDDVVAGRGHQVAISGPALAHNRDGELEAASSTSHTSNTSHTSHTSHTSSTSRSYRIVPGAWRVLC